MMGLFMKDIGYLIADFFMPLTEISQPRVSANFVLQANFYRNSLRNALNQHSQLAPK